MKVVLIIIAVILIVVIAVRVFIYTHPVFGGKPTDAEMKRMINSPNYTNGNFVNIEPTKVMVEGGSMFGTMLEWIKGPENGKPDSVVTVPFNKEKFLRSSDSSFKITWFGHSSALLNIGNNKILIDPVFSTYASPIPGTNKSFNFTANYSVEDLPDIDILLISHDHYDHLDKPTIEEIDNKVNQYIVPLGVKAHLIKWGVEESKIQEADWWDEFNLGDDLFLAATPARHFSGRGIKRNTTLWCSWVIKHSDGNVFFGADSGYGKHFKMIGEKYGPFDLTMIECGQYNKKWANIHALPEQSVQANIDLRGKLMMPIHWSKYQLALHSWTEPIERARIAAIENNVELLVPVIGDVVVISESD